MREHARAAIESINKIIIGIEERCSSDSPMNTEDLAGCADRVGAEMPKGHIYLHRLAGEILRYRDSLGHPSEKKVRSLIKDTVGVLRGETIDGLREGLGALGISTQEKRLNEIIREMRERADCYCELLDSGDLSVCEKRLWIRPISPLDPDLFHLRPYALYIDEGGAIAARNIPPNPDESLMAAISRLAFYQGCVLRLEFDGDTIGKMMNAAERLIRDELNNRYETFAASIIEEICFIPMDTRDPAATLHQVTCPNGSGCAALRGLRGWADHEIEKANHHLLLLQGAKSQRVEFAPPPNGDLIRWIAPDNAFADLIVELRKKGYIAATSDTEALNIAAPHFTDVNRDGDTLLQGVNNREYLGTGRGKASFKEIPAASDLNPKKTQGNFSSIPQARRRRRSKAETK